MDQPGSPSFLIGDQGEDWLVRRVQALEARVNELVAQDVLRAAGVETSADLFKILGTLRVTGDTVIEGNLAVPNGSITNDALANAAVGGVANTVTAVAWTVSTSMVTKASTSITVPAGFTAAMVTAHASMHFQDSSPNAGWVRAVIAGAAGGEMGGLANLNVGAAAHHTLIVTGLLPGGAIALDAQVRASVDSSVTTGRIAQISGSAIFFR